MIARWRAPNSSARTVRSLLRGSAGVAIALALAACSSSDAGLGEGPTSTSNSPDPTTAPATATGGPDSGGADSASAADPETTVAASDPIGGPARWSRIATSAVLAATGQSVVLETQPGLQGRVVLTGPGGFAFAAAMVDGRAEVVIPEDAPTGDYLAAVGSVDEQLAVGTITVVSEPTLRLSADRTHVAPGETVSVRLDAAEVPDDLLVMLGWGDVDWRAYALADDDDDVDADDEGEPLGFLVPDESDLLQPGADALPVVDVAGRSMTMVGMEVATLQALAFRPEGDQVDFSDPLVIDECATPVELGGTLGGPGSVRIVAFGDGLRSTGLPVADGTFDVAAPHGPLAVFGARDDGTELTPVVVEVPCGGSAEIDLPAARGDVTAPEPADPFDTEFVEGESGALQLTGDVATEFAVEPVCTSDGDSVEVIFGVYDTTLPGLILTVDDGGRPGASTGTIQLTDWAAGAARSSGPVDVTIAYSGSGVAEGAFTVAGRYEGAAGSGTISGEFTCAVLGLVPPPPAPDAPSDADEPTPDDPLGVPPILTRFDTPGADGTSPAAACRSVLVRDAADPHAGVRLAAQLRSSLPRAAVVTTSELDHLLRVVGPDRASTVVAAITAADAPDVVVDIGRDDVTISSIGSVADATWSASVPAADAAELLGERVLCVDAPATFAVPGETVTLPVTVTTLAGGPADGVQVRMTGPDGASTDTTTSAGRAALSFDIGEAGTVTVDIEAGSPEGVLGRVSAPIEVGAAYAMGGRWFVEGQSADPDSWIAPGRYSITLAAVTCAGIEGPWKGIWAVEAAPYLAGLQTALALNASQGIAAQESPGVLISGLMDPAGPDGRFGSAILPHIGSHFLGLDLLGNGMEIMRLDPESAIVAPLTLELTASEGPARVWIGGERATGLTPRYLPVERILRVPIGGISFNAVILPGVVCDQGDLETAHEEFVEKFEEWRREWLGS